MSILIYLLIVGKDGERPGYLMLAVGEAGTLAVVAAFLLLAARTGSCGFGALRASGVGLGEGARWAVFLLAFFGFGVKAGLAPVNFWLQRAYRAAPAGFAPLLAGATLNLGLYGIMRVTADLLPAGLVGAGVVALLVGAVTAFLGILYATIDDDLKSLLAHSSIENAGIITAAFGASMVFGATGHPGARRHRPHRRPLPPAQPLGLQGAAVHGRGRGGGRRRHAQPRPARRAAAHHALHRAVPAGRRAGHRGDAALQRVRQRVADAAVPAARAWSWPRSA